MKNKKGFTLVELLAVIAILAILVIIAMPNVLKRFNEAKKDTFITEVKKVYSEVTDAYVNNTLSGTNKTLYSSKTNDLDMTGELQYCVITDTRGNIKYMEVANGSYYAIYDTTKQIEKYNSSDVNEVNDDYVMDCSKKSISSVTPKNCSKESLTELSDKSGYKDKTYTYIYNKEYNAKDESTLELKNMTVEGYSVILNSELSEETNINVSPCTSIDGIAIVSTSFMFFNARSISNIDLSDFDTSQVLNMKGMFALTGMNSTKLHINVSNFDTKNVTDMSSMFCGAGFNSDEFEIVGLDDFETINVKNMFEMFELTGKSSSSWNIGKIDNWKTQNVENMSEMFSGAGVNAQNFNIGDLSKWDITKVTSMDGMFYETAKNAKEIEKIDLSGWIVPNGCSHYDFSEINSKLIIPPTSFNGS